jgi:hypothetical protein
MMRGKLFQLMEHPLAEAFLQLKGKLLRPHAFFNSGTRFTNFTKFLKKNPDNYLLAPLSGILPLACLLTEQDIPDISQAIYEFY